MKRIQTITIAGLVVLTLILIFSAYQASAQSINTGDANATEDVENDVNRKDITICDCTPTPTKTEETPTPTPTETEETPTPTPTDKPGDGGNGGNGGDGGGNGGVGGPEVGAAQGEVLGLAVTSGENYLFDLLKILPAFGLLLAGRVFLKGHA